MEQWEKILREAGEEMGIIFSDKQISLFAEYRDELLRWNAKMSLLSLKNPRDLPVKHFIDSLTVLPVLSSRHIMDPRVIDLGTGAGFPGIPLLIVQPSIRLTLLDSSRKKTSFLKTALRKIGRDDIPVINDRVEQVMSRNDLDGAFDVLVSRATFSLEKLLPPADHFLVPGGLLVAMKAIGADDELAKAGKVSSSSWMRYVERRDLELPGKAGSRSLLIFRKEGVFPRTGRDARP